MKQEEKLQEAKRLYKTANSDQKYVLETLFPELRESEDEIVEKIRKDIISYLNNRQITSIGESSATEKWLAWLEKQGENVSLPKFTFDDVLALQCCMETTKKIQEDKELYEQLQNLHDRLHDAYWLEKQGEKPVEEYNITGISSGYATGKLKEIIKDIESADKVELKFKVGDWVVLTAGELSTTLQIVNVDINKKLYWFNDSSYLPIVDEECLHYWTIADAKDGDVLVASDGSIFIFAGVVDCACKYYVALTSCNDVKINKEIEGGYWETSRAVHPATKEQYDLLFSKMKEAGYEWDAEKKVSRNLLGGVKRMKKIEQKPTDNDMVEALQTEYEKGRADAIAEMQNPAWSLDDEVELNGLIKHYEDGHVSTPQNRKTIKWLKSLKQRIGG